MVPFPGGVPESHLELKLPGQFLLGGFSHWNLFHWVNMGYALHD
jgi:hypothetical protein